MNKRPEPRFVGKTLICFNRLADDEKDLAERKWLESLRPAKPQQPCDHGLFSDDHLQLDLIEYLQQPGED